MKVILLQDVARIGKRSEVVDVPDGYAMNRLIPQRIAEPATAAKQKQAEQTNAAQAAKRAAKDDLFATALASLSAAPLEISAAVNEKDHLFQAIHADDIVTAAAARELTLEPGMIEIPEPIKAVGDHPVTLRVNDQAGTFTVRVVAKS